MRLASALLVAMLAACAVPGGGYRPGSLDDLPLAAELDQVPFYPQQRYQCGPAALATVLVHQGRDTSPERLRPRVYLPQRKGSIGIEMIAAARAHRTVVYPLEPALGHLLREVAAGNPVLVLQNLSFNWMPRWHYAVVVGFNRDTQRLILRSGTTRRWETSFAAFDRTWARGGRWGIVALAPERLPVTATADAYLRAVTELETTGDPATANRAYLSAAERWPEAPAAWFGLANTAYALGRVPAAGQAFARAIALAPDSGAVWNNYAYALAAMGCGTEALDAARCAVRRAPQDAQFTASLRELQEAVGAASGAACPAVVCP